MARAHELRRLGQAWNEAWNSRDPAQLARLFADGSTFYEPNLSESMGGAEGVVASATRIWSEWPRAVFEAVSITVEEPRVVVEWRTSAAHRSGLAHVLEGVDILEFDGDLIRACRTYYDTRTHTPRASGVKASRYGPAPRRSGRAPAGGPRGSGRRPSRKSGGR